MVEVLFQYFYLCSYANLKKFWAQKGVQLSKKGSLSPLWRHGVQYETIELLRDSMSKEVQIVQCNPDLVTHLVCQKSVTKSRGVTK